MRTHVVLCATILAAGCSDPGPDTPVSLLPADYATTFSEVRNCRRSADHDLNFIRILADGEAAPAYTARNGPFPAGSVIVKEEYDPIDDTCSLALIGWTVMVSQGPGGAPDELDFEWQRIAEDKVVVDKPTGHCVSCHTSCGAAPDGYLGTCAVP
jgi:hypothetical protein